LQAVGLGKEIRYDLASITVKFMLLQYKDQPMPIYSFTHSERAALHNALNKIVMAAEILRAVCAVRGYFSISDDNTKLLVYAIVGVILRGWMALLCMW
jgi:hypothetical protein